MARLGGGRSPKRGLGLLFVETGLALAQSQRHAPSAQQHCAWHWHGCLSAQDAAQNGSWPDPAELRKAMASSGFQAQATALAVPEAQLQRHLLSMEAGLSRRQMHTAIAGQLKDLSTLPLQEIVWDFQVLPEAPSATTASAAQPAWLQAAMQTHTPLRIEVLVIAREWVHACETWCQSAGLQLIRLEPSWQASARWKLFATSQETAKDERWATTLTDQQFAVAAGLALGVVMP